MEIDILNIKKTVSKIKNLEEYNLTPIENNYIIQAGAFDLMTTSEMKATIILMGNKIDKLISLNVNLEQALDNELKKNEQRKSI